MFYRRARCTSNPHPHGLHLDAPAFLGSLCSSLKPTLARVGRKRARERGTSGIARVGRGQTREGAREVITSTIYQENV